jgi:hypothetical protein
LKPDAVLGRSILLFVKNPDRVKTKIVNAQSHSYTVYATIPCHIGEVILARFEWLPSSKHYLVRARVIGTCRRSKRKEIAAAAAADALSDKDKLELLKLLPILAQDGQ